MHTLTKTGKSYIGYTSKSVSERLERHYKNAFIYNLQNHWYRALRKHGMDSIKTKVLAEARTRDEGLILEREFIDKYDTYKNGYNQTLGGTGGVTIDKNRDPEKWQAWHDKKLQHVQGANNPRYSGYTDAQLVDIAVQLYIDNDNKFTYGIWKRQCQTSKTPLCFSKMRFDGGGFAGFKKNIKLELTRRGIEFKDDDFIYKRTTQHQNKLKKINTGKHWFTDGVCNLMTYSHDPRVSGWKRGRTLNKNKTI